MTTNINVLILGATGKTGIPIVEQALQAGLNVRAVIRREDHRSEQLRLSGAETVIGDVHDLQSVRRLVEGVRLKPLQTWRLRPGTQAFPQSSICLRSSPEKTPAARCLVNTGCLRTFLIWLTSALFIFAQRISWRIYCSS